MPRVKKIQLSEQTITTNRPHQLAINDNSIVNSRTICRADLMLNNKFEGTSGSSNARFDLENTPSSTSTFGSIAQSNMFNIQSLKAEHFLGFKPEYDINKKLENFAVSSTPRQISKPNSSVTPVAR